MGSIYEAELAEAMHTGDFTGLESEKYSSKKEDNGDNPEAGGHE